MAGSPLLQAAELIRLGTGAKELAFEALRGKTTAIYFSGTWMLTASIGSVAVCRFGLKFQRINRSQLR